MKQCLQSSIVGCGVRGQSMGRKMVFDQVGSVKDQGTFFSDKNHITASPLDPSQHRDKATQKLLFVVQRLIEEVDGFLWKTTKGIIER